MPITEGAFPASAQRAGSRLSAAARAGLRDAFAGEVRERLPRLRSAASTLDPAALREALRDVHTLGSSAYVVGADEVARIARAAEEVLLADGPQQDFRLLVADLEHRLQDWLR